MKEPNYWEKYPVFTHPDEIELTLSKDFFHSEGKDFELLRFISHPSAENVLITPGSGGHAYVFAELAYLIHKQGFNVFIMLKHGGFTITELSKRHRDAIDYLRSKYSGGVHIYGEGLGGLVIFYLALAGISVQSIICENAPAILTDKQFHKAMKHDGAAGKRRTLLLPLFRLLVKIFPSLPIPIKAYLGWKEIIDKLNEHNKNIEERLIEAYINDPDFDRYYPLKAVMSLVNTPPPNSLAAISIPIMFILARRGLIPGYFKNLFMQIPIKTKKLQEIDGGVFWMVSNPLAASKTICNWVQELTSNNISNKLLNHENH